jgi:hypothetical protein
MAALPPAIIDNPPLHRRPVARKLGAAVLVIGACIGARKIWHVAMRSDSNKQLEKLQDKARARVGHGLDSLFADQLDRDSNTLRLTGMLSTTGSLDGAYGNDGDCARGLEVAFDEVLGKDVIGISTFDFDDGAPKLELVAKLAATDQAFQLPHSDKSYNGVSMSADVKLVGTSFHVDVNPPEKFTFSFFRSGAFDALSESQIRGGITQGVCQQLGYEILERTTTWKRPAPEQRDPEKDCAQGFGCRDRAAQTEDADPAKAAEMYRHACEDNDEDACLRSAELEVQLAKGHDAHVERASVLLTMACLRDLVRTCAAAARVILLSDEPGKPPSEQAREEALPLLLRGCDLGNQEACDAAVPVARKTAFAEAVPLLTGAKSVRSKKFGTIFALRWGQWAQLDSGQATLWVTKEPAHLPDGWLSTRFDRSELPKDVRIPDGIDVVYAVARKAMGEPCQRCNPSGGGDGIYNMRSLDCVCWVAPH